MSICTRCYTRGKTWQGDDPRCGFDLETGLFKSDNWNCATLNELRELADKLGVVHWSEDENLAVVPIGHISIETCIISASFLLIGWYKNRGATTFLKFFDGIDKLEDVRLKQVKYLLDFYILESDE